MNNSKRELVDDTDRIVKKRARILSDAAWEIYQAIEAGGFADRELSSRLRKRRDIMPPDKGFLSQVIFSLCRWQGWTKPEQLQRHNGWEKFLVYSWMMDASTPHPVVKCWSQKAGVPWFKIKERMPMPRPLVKRARIFADLISGNPPAPHQLFPSWLHTMLPKAEVWGYHNLSELYASLQRPAELWIRFQNGTPEVTARALKAEGHVVSSREVLPMAAILRAYASLSKLDVYLEGKIESQDVSSQVIGLICNPKPGERWWDACAGVGGKTMHLAAQMENKGYILATDIAAFRLKALRVRAKRGGFCNVRGKPWDGKSLPLKKNSCDGVLIDAPCSASGTWRRNPEGRALLTREKVAELCEIQLRLLKLGATAVRPGGVLIYATCSILEPENDGVVGKFLAENNNFELEKVVLPLGNTETDGRVWIPPDWGDGMYVARMRSKK